MNPQTRIAQHGTAWKIRRFLLCFLHVKWRPTIPDFRISFCLSPPLLLFNDAISLRILRIRCARVGHTCLSSSNYESEWASSTYPDRWWFRYCRIDWFPFVDAVAHAQPEDVAAPRQFPPGLHLLERKRKDLVLGEIQGSHNYIDVDYVFHIKCGNIWYS